MRNYCRYWVLDFVWSVTDPAPNSGHTVLWSRTEADLMAQNESFLSGLNQPLITIVQSGQFYVLLDTDTVLYMLQNLGQFGVVPSAWQKENPRQTWFPAYGTAFDKYHGPDAAGHKGGSGTFSGAPNPALGWMIAIYDALVNKGYVYPARQVYSVIRQYLAKVISLDAAVARVARIANAV